MRTVILFSAFLIADAINPDIFDDLWGYVFVLIGIAFVFDILAWLI